MARQIWTLEEGAGPVIGAAIHAGHLMRPDLLALTKLTEAERLREEDPFTNLIAEACPTRLIGTHSRFEVDLNRPPGSSVYLSQEEAWGLDVWHNRPSNFQIQESQEEHSQFYETYEDLLDRKLHLHDRLLVLDIHSYNHRREGPESPPAAQEENPDVNIGTGSLDRTYWGPVVNGLIHALRGYEFLGRQLDVRENVKFRGRYFAAFAHETFPGEVCVLSLEFKKFWMDEWTGQVDWTQLNALRQCVAHAIPTALTAMRQTGGEAASARR